MGQYYKPINLKSFEFEESWDFDNGSKLMEHSWIGNDFVGSIMKLLTKGNKWYKGKIVWAGDYSKPIYKKLNFYGLCCDEEDLEKGDINLFNKIQSKEYLSEEEQKKAIIVNHSRKEYVKLSNCREEINPLPLLTALGNGQGSGDYRGLDMSLIGRWALDKISVEFDENDLKDFTELETDFKEGEEEGESEENENQAIQKISEWVNNKEVKEKILLRTL